MLKKGMALLLMAVLLMLCTASIAEENGTDRMNRIFDILTDRKQDPTTFADYDRLAKMAYARGEYDDALSYLDECIALSAGDAMTLGLLWTQKAVIYDKQGKAEAALEALDTAQPHTPDYPQMLFLRGELLLAQKDYDLAIESLERYTALLPEDASGWSMLAEAYKAKNEHKQAAEAQDKADALSASEGNAVLTAGRNAALMGDLETAQQHYTAYLDAYSDESGAVHFMRAAVRILLNLNEEAIADLDAALALGYAEPAVCYEYLSLCYFVLSDYPKVIEAGEMAAGLDSATPDHGTLYQRMALSAMALDNLASAETYFTQSMEHDEALVGNLYYRSLARLGQERYEEALEDLTRSIGRGELTQRCLYYRGLCQVELGDIDAGINDLEAAMSVEGEAEIAAAAEDTLWQLALQYIQP